MGEIFLNRPDRPRPPPRLLYKCYRVSLPGVKREWRGVDHRTTSGAEVKERVELYLYSPSELSWPVLGCNLPLPFTCICVQKARLASEPTCSLTRFTLAYPVLCFTIGPITYVITCHGASRCDAKIKSGKSEGRDLQLCFFFCSHVI